MEYNSSGIICTTQEQVDALHAQLKKDFRPKLLDARGVAFGSAVVVTTAHLAKGLEFDQVLVPQVNDGNYKTAADRQMLFVACTRAMHSLVLSFAGKPSRFIA